MLKARMQVCFRSFDQDIYSPTHLEPLNMYIIVFREGTLSVSAMSPLLQLRDIAKALNSFTSVELHIRNLFAGESNN